MARRYIVCNTSWMLRYHGARGDKAYGGGAYVRAHGHGSESTNFKSLSGKHYGYVSAHGESINLGRLGAEADQDTIPGVTVVWTAPRPNYGQVVVGWYRNAVAHRSFRESPHLHYFTCRPADAKLLPANERTLRVPRGAGAMGQSNVWYADTPKGRRFLAKVEDLIAGRLAAPARRRGGHAWQKDLKTRLRIEKKAVEVVAGHFERRGYTLTDVQRDCKGWDLEATRDGLLYRLEVKGLGGRFEGIELTPNEYVAMRQYPETFCLCVVSDIETKAKPRPSIYEYAPEEKAWVTAGGKRLGVEPRKVISARCAPLS